MSLPILRRGSRGNEVLRLQELIFLRGFPVDKDGIFGRGTEEAVVTIQMAEGLDADGIVGPATWKAIEEPDSSEKSTSPAPSDERQGQIDWVISEIPEDAHPTARAMLLVAAGFLGASEEPKGSNHGPQIAPLVEGYAHYWGIRPPGYYPWCAMYAVQCIRMSLGVQWEDASLPFDGKWQGSGYQMELWAKKHGKWIPASQTPPAGAIFIMGRGGSGSDKSSTSTSRHVGIVVKPGAKHLCLGGNESDKVKASYRKPSSLMGYIVWW